MPTWTLLHNGHRKRENPLQKQRPECSIMPILDDRHIPVCAVKGLHIIRLVQTPILITPLNGPTTKPAQDDSDIRISFNLTSHTCYIRS